MSRRARGGEEVPATEKSLPPYTPTASQPPPYSTAAGPGALTGLVEGAVPEVAVAQGVSKHMGSVMMMPAEIVGIIFVVIGIILYSASSKSRSAGILFLLLGFGIGGFAFYTTLKAEERVKS
jgi:hypothetical protein